MKCRMAEQGYEMGNCLVELPSREKKRACEATLRQENDTFHKVIKAAHLSRPEHYLSIYQSGCNHNCKKCHSWQFSQLDKGEWYSTDQIADLAREYERYVTYWEPRERATMWHATDLCRSCGSCVIKGQRSAFCPGVLDPQQVVFSPQGFGPARNIVAFTGGDIACHADFYAQAMEKIKARCWKMWGLLETNGYGLIPAHLDSLRDNGVDSFWLDIKAADPSRHRWLTGCDNQWILELPNEMLKRNFVLEVLSLYIPGVVDAEELGQIAERLAAVNKEIPFTILAFFPQYRMQDFRPPTVEEMVRAYEGAKTAGLTAIRLGNLGVFAKTNEDYRFLEAHVDNGAY